MTHDLAVALLVGAAILTPFAAYVVATLYSAKVLR